jgi:hypothetical protein
MIHGWRTFGAGLVFLTASRPQQWRWCIVGTESSVHAFNVERFLLSTDQVITLTLCCPTKLVPFQILKSLTRPVTVIVDAVFVSHPPKGAVVPAALSGIWKSLRKAGVGIVDDALPVLVEVEGGGVVLHAGELERRPRLVARQVLVDVEVVQPAHCAAIVDELRRDVRGLLAIFLRLAWSEKTGCKQLKRLDT